MLEFLRPSRLYVIHRSSDQENNRFFMIGRATVEKNIYITLLHA